MMTATNEEIDMATPLGGIELSLPPDVHPRLAPLGAWRQTLDNTARAYAREVQEAVRAFLGEAPQFDDALRALYREVLAGKATEVQPVRERFLNAYADRARLLREAHDLVRHAERVAQSELPEAAQLEREAEALERKLKKLASRWVTAEDLEDLAAESIAPSAKQLEAVRQKHGYPQAWYDDDSKPF
jgi:hypothetical protein